jgi:ferredoxin
LSDRKIEVEKGFTVEQALRETQRCLNCDVQTVFDETLCIECDACEDVCPTDCINFVENEEEDLLRKNLKMPAENLEQSLYVSADLKTKRAMVKDENVCLHCGLCAERCPTGAWDMRKFLLNEAKAGNL